ncbi:hypothetical protein BZL30_9420 [Mycobacterium kansasii]|uniref:Uncharacterized protein n=1 Tax=Mycobacterium kansasii TaxID=1768 RepID=A0A1V3W9I9_MYCKA|nr:hypothetical protein BZL30_9420 [Mycobacterium kansasii]
MEVTFAKEPDVELPLNARRTSPTRAEQHERTSIGARSSRCSPGFQWHQSRYELTVLGVPVTRT